ncbi:cGMP-dependent protein kinase, isozyme 2 forms cD4/T1/T3A/T3B [Armadillidium vulgare]|nr:cGMP-dependent protein kinase, isozyme 2 forms cD4/T1/T3A/T3B [Armadillidium vulgare]
MVIPSKKMNKWFKSGLKHSNPTSKQKLLTRRPRSLKDSDLRKLPTANEPKTERAINQKTLVVEDHLTRSLDELQMALSNALDVSNLKEKVIRSLQEEIQLNKAIIDSLRREVEELREELETRSFVEERKRKTLQDKNVRNTFPFHELSQKSKEIFEKKNDSKCLLRSAIRSQKVHRTAISAEPFDASLNPCTVSNVIEKSLKSKELIEHAILDNDFLKNLQSDQVREIVDSMYSEEKKAGETVIQEGDTGKVVYVIEGN